MSNEEKEKVLDKIRKVLELSKNNPSEEEAKAAALKAQELLAQYHIDMAELETEIGADDIGTGSVTLGVSGKWKYMLANIIADNFRCKLFFVGSNVICFVGHKTDVEIAQEVFKQLFYSGQSLATSLYYKTLKEKGTAKGVMNSFYGGYCDGIKAELDSQCTALKLVVPDDVKDAYAEMTKDMKARATIIRSKRVNDAYDKGYSEGKNAMQSRKIEGGN